MKNTPLGRALAASAAANKSKGRAKGYGRGGSKGDNCKGYGRGGSKGDKCDKVTLASGFRSLSAWMGFGSGRLETTSTIPAGTPYVGPASAQEMGDWDFGGHRRWHWMHDGSRINGWIMFGARGTLSISFNRVAGTHSWSRRLNGQMVIMFGSYHHICILEELKHGQPASFMVIDREFKDGQPPKPPRFQTRGELDTTGDHNTFPSGRQW